MALNNLLESKGLESKKSLSLLYVEYKSNFCVCSLLTADTLYGEGCRMQQALASLGLCPLLAWLL